MANSEHIEYWQETAEQDRTAMLHLFENKDYHWALFMGHLVVEKLLKAYFVKVKSDPTPFIHDLLRIAKKKLI